LVVNKITFSNVLAKDAPRKKPAPKKPEWIPIDSENLKAIMYDPIECNLIVRFQSNESIGYAYGAVSQTLFEGLQKSDSPTAYLRRFIIPRHRVVRIKL
jgi:hypothetical protein